MTNASVVLVLYITKGVVLSLFFHLERLKHCFILGAVSLRSKNSSFILGDIILI